MIFRMGQTGQESQTSEPMPSPRGHGTTRCGIDSIVDRRISITLIVSFFPTLPNCHASQARARLFVALSVIGHSAEWLRLKLEGLSHPCLDWALASICL